MYFSLFAVPEMYTGRLHMWCGFPVQYLFFWVSAFALFFA